jgi:S-DNA-T family DNA segregation ATPase FtsK/SpoIIIE
VRSFYSDIQRRGFIVSSDAVKRPSGFIALSLILALLSIYSLITLVLHLVGAGGIFSLPGRLLLEAFSWASFFVPVYFMLAFMLLYAPVFRRRRALILMFSIVPFLTVSLLLHVLDNSPLALPQLLLSSLGMVPSAILLCLLVAIELAFIVTFPSGLSTAAMADGRGPVPPRKKPMEAPVKYEAEVRSGPAAPDAAAIEAGPISGVEITPLSARFGPAPGDIPAIAEEIPSPCASQEHSRPPRMDLPPTGQQELPFQHPKDAVYSIPVEGVLKVRSGEAYWEIDDETRRAARILTEALQEFSVQAEVTGIRKGPVITLFEVLPAQGVRVSKIANLADNIALRLAAPSVRIVAPIPGKHAVGIEVPNKKRAIVSFREMIVIEAMRTSGYEIPIALGKDILGEAQIIDLTQTPHLLIGGATNSGKSVLVNAVICSILFRKSPDEVRLFLIDPKIVELKSYNGIPHLFTPVITDPRRAFQALQYCISEMERRYTLLDALGVRDIKGYNKKARREKVQRLPHIVIVIDEFADLMATTGKELESTLARLAAMARAVGIHMVLATQRPSIDVITGLIKANIPSRIAFMVANKFDSRIIIDSVGAEKLLGKGDMLFSAAWNPFPVRIQGAYVDEEETEAITDYVKKLGPPHYIDDEVFFDDEEEGGDFEGEPGNDPLFERALEIVIAQGKASASYIQRRLKVGYNRAARLVEEMETRGIVGPAQGSKPRDILHVPKG